MDIRITVIDDNNVSVIIAFSSAYKAEILEAITSRTPRIKVKEWDIPMSRIQEISFNNYVFENKARRK
jgi:hypothetical protein